MAAPAVKTKTASRQKTSFEAIRVIEIAKLMTDPLQEKSAANDELASAALDVWSWEGTACGSSAPTGSVTNNLRFPGMYADAESGLYYNGQRYYDPKTCRYITADRVSVGQHAQKWMDLMGIVPNQPPLELNPFVYVANNPLRWTDPNGEAIQAVMYCAAAALIAYSGYKLYGKYDCQKNCQLACAQKYGCQTGNCPLAEGDTRGLTNCKSECVLSCWMGMGKKGPMGPTPGGPATNPPYIPPGKLD